MRYTVRESIVEIIGNIWWPMGATCAQCKTLNSYDVENCRDENGKITRESVDQWLAVNSGDFSRVLDFCASIEDGDHTVDIPWRDEESELTYSDCMFPSEE